MRLDKFPTPGLKRRPRKNGPDRLYWVARGDLVKAGYEPQTVPLRYDPDADADRPLISAHCMRLQAEMLEWNAGLAKANRFDGTIRGLSRRFQADRASPFVRSWKWKTREKETYTLRTIEAAFGDRSLAALKLSDFVRWYDAAAEPKVVNGPRRLNKAYRIIKMLRAMFSYGVAAELSQCARLLQILSHTRFPQPNPRRVRLEAVQAQAFIKAAIENRRLSLALGTALQFETTLRQEDVIGEWEPTGAQATGGILLRGRRWVGGLTWGDIDSDLILRKTTIKSGYEIEVCHDLKVCPLVSELIGMIPFNDRVGPVILDETAGRPYATSAYAREWRKIARLAAIPDDIWNMDARAGGVSEGDEAGAGFDLIRAQTGHTQEKTMRRYARGDTLERSRRAGELRMAHRAMKNGA